MKRTTPLLLTVTGLCAGLLALAMFWLAVLPDKLALALQTEIENRTGLHAKISGSALSIRDGLSIRLDNVTLTENEVQSVAIASVDQISAGLSLANIFGGKLRLRSIDLESPVINIKTEAKALMPSEAEAGVAAPQSEKPARDLTINLHNGTVKWSDAERHVAFAVSDLNGIVTTELDGSAQLDLSGLFNGKLTRLAATIDDLRRLKADGSPSDVTLSAGKNAISFSGRTLIRNGMQMDGSLSVSAENLRDLATWFGGQFSGFAQAGSFKTESSISWDGARLDLNQLTITLDQSKITGSASLDLKQARPALEATLDADHIDLGIYGKTTNRKEPPLASPLSNPWKESPMEFRDLTSMDAKLSVTAGKFTVAGLETGKAALLLELKDGSLAMKLSSDDVAGGQANAEVQVAQDGEVPDVSLKLSAKNVGAKAFLQPLTGFGAVDGPISLQADLSSQGNSTARIISSLSGQAELSISNGTINGLVLAEFLSGKGKGWRLSSNKTTAVTSGEAKFELQDGVAQITSFNVESNGLKLVASGEIDLLRQNLDIICRPEIAGEIKLPVQLAVVGPWTDPSVDADIDSSRHKPKALLKTGKKAIKKLFGNQGLR